MKGSKEDLDIIHEAAKKEAYLTFRPVGLSRQASEQLQEIIHHTGHHHPEGKEPVISETEGEDTEFIALDMVNSKHENGDVKQLPAISNGPDVVISVSEQSSSGKNKCTCNHGRDIDTCETLPWCDVCIASASPSKHSETKLQDMDLKRRYPTSWLEQYKVLTVRAFKQSRSLFLTKIDFIRHGFLAVIIGILYFQLPLTENRIHDIRGLVCIYVKIVSHHITS